MHINLPDLISSLNPPEHFDTVLTSADLVQIIIDVLGLDGIHRVEQFKEEGTVFKKTGGLFGRISVWTVYVVEVDEDVSRSS